jgi:hypothetical protein
VEVTGQARLDVRLELLRKLPSDPHNYSMQDLTKQLVGNDLETYEVLLSRADLDYLHDWGLAAHPDERWLKRVEVALKNGISVERIVAQCWWADRVTWGPLSQSYRAWAQEFELLRKSAPRRLRHVADAGVRRYTRLADEEERKERKEAIYGRSA